MVTEVSRFSGGGRAMRVVVTGATGFVGGRAARHLVALGHDVLGLGRAEAAGRALAQEGVRFERVDVTDREALRAVMCGRTHVVHAAALSSPWGNEETMVRTNVLGTRNVLAAARAAGVERVVHISSPSIYVDRRDRLGIREDAPLPRVSINAYARTKRLAEEEVDRVGVDGLDVITLRPQAVFGPGDTALFPRLIRVARKGVFPVIGSGRNLIDVTYVDNVAHAIALALAAPSVARGRKLNITNGEPVPFYPLIDRVLATLGIDCRRPRLPRGMAYGFAGVLEAAHRLFFPEREPLLTRYSVMVLASTRTLDISAAEAVLGYRPVVRLEEGLARTLRALGASSAGALS